MVRRKLKTSDKFQHSLPNSVGPHLNWSTFLKWTKSRTLFQLVVNTFNEERVPCWKTFAWSHKCKRSIVTPDWEGFKNWKSLTFPSANGIIQWCFYIYMMLCFKYDLNVFPDYCEGYFVPLVACNGSLIWFSTRESGMQLCMRICLPVCLMPLTGLQEV